MRDEEDSQSKKIAMNLQQQIRQPTTKLEDQEQHKAQQQVAQEYKMIELRNDWDQPRDKDRYQSWTQQTDWGDGCQRKISHWEKDSNWKWKATPL